MVALTIDADAATGLRRLAMRLCGERMEFMRIAAGGAGTVRVWLCVSAGIVAPLVQAVRHSLPTARFDRIPECHGRVPS